MQKLLKLNKDELPELHDLEQPKSASAIKNFKEALNADPKDTFIKLRNEVAMAYKSSGDINTYKDDLRKIDVMEDTYDTRLVINDGIVEKALGQEFKTKEKK